MKALVMMLSMLVSVAYADVTPTATVEANTIMVKATVTPTFTKTPISVNPSNSEKGFVLDDNTIAAYLTIMMDKNFTGEFSLSTKEERLRDISLIFYAAHMLKSKANSLDTLHDDPVLWKKLVISQTLVSEGEAELFYDTYMANVLKKQKERK